MWDDASTSYFYKLGCVAAFEKIGITLEQARAAMTQEDPRAQQWRAWMQQQLGEGGMYQTMDPGLARYIHQKDLRKQRATIPQLAGVFGVDVPSPFQQFVEPAPEAVPVPKQAASLERPEDQTFQIHREVESPATNGPEGPHTSTTTGNLEGIWNEHDRMVETKNLPQYDNLTGL